MRSDTETCTPEQHIYPLTGAISPEYADDYFNTCKCGRMRMKVVEYPATPDAGGK